MDDSSLRDFFLAPSSPRQRQYEALRCVFVEGASQKEVAERFGYSYGAFRQLVLLFRTRLDAGQPPPFFTRRPNALRPNGLNRFSHPTPPLPSNRPSPTSAV